MSKSYTLRESVKFVGNLCNFTDFITILIKKRLPFQDVYWRDEFSEKTAQLLIKRINQRVYGRAYMKGNKTLGTAISYEVGSLTNRPHFHLAIECPSNFTKQGFLKCITKVVSSMEWLVDKIDIKDYKNIGCIKYLCKGNSDKVILSGCSRSK